MSDTSLADGANRTEAYTSAIHAAGLGKVPLLLFRDGDVSVAYRTLHLLVRVGIP